MLMEKCPNRKGGESHGSHSYKPMETHHTKRASNMKKKIYKIVGLSLLCLAIVVAIGWLFQGVIVGLFYHAGLWQYNAEFEEYRAEFTTVKDYIAEQYPDSEGIYVATTPKGLYDPRKKEYLQLPDDVASALEVIERDGFPNQEDPLDLIWIDGERITFANENGQYGLVYSPLEEPTWLHHKHKDEDVKVKVIGDGWYHVADPS